MPILSDFTVEQQLTMPIENLTALRRQAFEAHVAALPSDVRMSEWVRRMTRRFRSPVVGIGLHGGAVSFPRGDGEPFINGSPLSWLAALFVGMYGEDTSYWPNEITEFAIERALAWEKRGKGFHGVVLIDGEE